jgi:hypothetical protein
LAFATVCRAEDSFRARPSSASRFTAAVCVAPSAAMYPEIVKRKCQSCKGKQLILDEKEKTDALVL